MCPIYLDNHATTPCDPRVVQAMLPYFTETFGNPSSTIHSAGRKAAGAVERARGQVADVIKARAGEIVFTSGATESNNLAILGLARGTAGKRKGIVTTEIEHKSVLGPCKHLQKLGYELDIIEVDRAGRVDINGVRHAVSKNTLLVSVQAANNEIGTIQSISDIAEIAHAQGAVMHCDAAQAVGKIPVDVETWDVDLLSISAHKVYGPKGSGALFVRGGINALPVDPLTFGGDQEQGLRPGTLNVPCIVGFGEACSLANQLLEIESRRVAALRDELERTLLDSISGLRRNGALDKRLPGNANLTFPGIDAEALIANLTDIALSTGSACTTGAPEPSYVLLAIGLTREEAYSTIRVGVGRFTSDREIDQAADAIIEAVGRLRSL